MGRRREGRGWGRGEKGVDEEEEVGKSVGVWVWGRISER